MARRTLGKDLWTTRTSALVERALQPVRDELAKLRAVVQGEGVSVAEAARRLGFSERTVKRRVRDGTLPSVRVGGARRVLVGALLQDEAPPPPRRRTR